MADHAETTVTYAPRHEPGECAICEIQLPEHEEARFALVAGGYTAVCGDCAGDFDYAKASAVRVLNTAVNALRRLPPGSPAVEAFHATLDRGLRQLRGTHRETS